MAYEDMEHYTPEEALDAFLDGELGVAEEQPLFDQLQASPDLRGNMKDALSIRAAVHKDLIAPPAESENAVLAAVGLGAGAAATAAATGTAVGGAAAAASTGVLSRLFPFLYTGGGVIAGFLLAWFLMDQGQESGASVASTSNGGGGSEIVAGRSQQAPTSPANVAVTPDTVYAVKYITRTVPVFREDVVPNAKEQVPVTVELAQESTTMVEPTESSPLTITTVSADHLLLRSDVLPMSSTTDMRSADRLSPRTSQPMVTFRARTLASGLPSDKATPQSVQDATLPNTAFALLFPVASGHSVGLEMGTESFRQEFNGMEDDRQVVYTQTPVLFWMGATYSWIPAEFSFLPGLAPFFDATLGFAFQQGPVTRGTIGLTYQPIGPLRFNVGLDGSALMYENENAWYSSTKLGPSFGISLDLGAIR